MKKIIIKASPSEISQRIFTATCEDLGFTEEKWNRLSQEEKAHVITVYLDELPEHPYWSLDEFDED